MNEQQNTDTVKTMYAAFGRGDIQVILDRLTDDVEWSMEGPSIIAYAGKRHGRSEALAFFQALGTTQDNQKLTIDTYSAQGDVVATVGNYGATVKSTGKSYHVRIAHFFTFHDGKVSKFEDFGDTAAIADAYQQTAAAATR